MNKWIRKAEEIHPKVSVRPWELSHDIENDTMDILDGNGNLILEDYSFGGEMSDYDAEHIIRCVNEYEQAIKEIERLEDVITKLKLLIWLVYWIKRLLILKNEK